MSGERETTKYAEAMEASADDAEQPDAVPDCVDDVLAKTEEAIYRLADALAYASAAKEQMANIRTPLAKATESIDSLIAEIGAAVEMIGEAEAMLGEFVLVEVTVEQEPTWIERIMSRFIGKR